MELGANVEALEHLAETLQREADRIDGIRASVTNEIFRAWWQGGDATAFRSDWDDRYSLELRSIVEDLSINSNVVRSQAWAQRETSSY